MFLINPETMVANVKPVTQKDVMLKIKKKLYSKLHN